tara:strand:+ start:209 stop:571 length:363 start_codon:yes stop_codon:yes gene_type:complete
MRTVNCVAVEYYDYNRSRIEIRIAGNTLDEYHEIRHQLIGELPSRMRWSRIDRGVRAILYFQTEVPLSEELETRQPALGSGVERVSPPDAGGMGAQADEMARLDWEDEQAATREAYAEHG